MKPTLFLFLALLALSGPARAQTPQAFRGDYSISLWGLTIARSTFTSTFSGSDYVVEGQVRSAGLARVFDSTNGDVRVSGTLSAKAIAPAAYRMSYTSGKRSKSISIDFAGAKVSRTEVVPARRRRGDDWVALDEGDLARVTDPLTSSLVRAASLDRVCDATLKVYDGQSRMDLKLAHAGVAPVAVPGYEGDAVTCTARFQPRSGYRPNHKSIRFLKDKANIRIAFAPLGSTGVYAPIRASIDTELGTVTVRADRYGSR